MAGNLNLSVVKRTALASGNSNTSEEKEGNVAWEVSRECLECCVQVTQGDPAMAMRLTSLLMTMSWNTLHQGLLQNVKIVFSSHRSCNSPSRDAC